MDECLLYFYSLTTTDDGAIKVLSYWHFCFCGTDSQKCSDWWKSIYILIWIANTTFLSSNTRAIYVLPAISKSSLFHQKLSFLIFVHLLNGNSIVSLSIFSWFCFQSIWLSCELQISIFWLVFYWVVYLFKINLWEIFEY